MSAPLLVVNPTGDHGVVGGLRALADRIEAGVYGEVRAIALVLDAEAKRTTMHFGRTSAPNTHFLLALGMRDIEEDHTA